MDFLTLMGQCAPNVNPHTMAAIVKTESNFNPYAIGVVGEGLKHQPNGLSDALVRAQALKDSGRTISLGISQIHHQHLKTYGLTLSDAFDPCINLKVGAKILSDCYQRARRHFPSEQASLAGAFSCYYSGNFTRGFAKESGGKSYVQRVLGHAKHLDSVWHAEPKEVIVEAKEVGHDPIVF